MSSHLARRNPKPTAPAAWHASTRWTAPLASSISVGRDCEPFRAPGEMSTHLVFRESSAALPSARHPWAPRSADQIETRVLFRPPATNPTPAFFAFARYASPTKRKRRMVHLMGGINVVAAAQADGRQAGALLLSDHASSKSILAHPFHARGLQSFGTWEGSRHIESLSSSVR